MNYVSRPLVPAALMLAGLAGLAALGSYRALAGGQEAPLLVTGRALSPLGRQTEVGSFPANMLLSPDGRYLVVTDQGARQSLSVISAETGALVSKLDFNSTRKDAPGKKEGLYYGLAFGTPKEGHTPLYASRGAEDRVSVFHLDSGGNLTDSGLSLDDRSPFDAKFPHHVAGVALSRDGSHLYAVNNNTGRETGFKGSLSIIDTSASRMTATAPLPGFPYAVVAVTVGTNTDRKVYVSGERDGVVSVVDPGAAKVTSNIATGDAPVALLLDRKSERLFVANAGSDTISVIDTATDRVKRTIPLRPEDARGLPGCTPTGLALSPDESRLFVALADMNAVGVVDAKVGRLLGYVPVGWYPTAVCASPDGKRLFVANAKGALARNPNGNRKTILNLLEGTVSTLAVPDAKELKQLTREVIENCRATKEHISASSEGFRNPGIQHVLYIIKENRTYDQVFGDLPQGNGDPKLCLFGREITPNQHALAERFALLDNFYDCAEVSGDGWNWSTAGMASAYVQRNVPYSYGSRGRSFDYEGLNNGLGVELEGVPDVGRPSGGYLWDLAAKHGVSLRNYGCYVHVEMTDQGFPVQGKESPAGNRATKKPLVGCTDEDYRHFDMAYADSDAWVVYKKPALAQRRSFGRHGAKCRYEEWKREFDEYVRSGNLPRINMLRLGQDHTEGTTPGYFSPRAMVADNDYAVGQIVEAVSRSRYWKSTAIFIIEDDAQSGFDHVDCHRSLCLVISPFVRKGTVDHHFYNTDSVLHTIELLNGLPPMCQYDAIAPAFRFLGPAGENEGPYKAILPAEKIVTEVNGVRTYGAERSARMDFSKEDAVDEAEMNDILWHAVKGSRAPKPRLTSGLRLTARRD